MILFIEGKPHSMPILVEKGYLYGRPRQENNITTTCCKVKSYRRTLRLGFSGKDSATDKEKMAYRALVCLCLIAPTGQWFSLTYSLRDILNQSA